MLSSPIRGAMTDAAMMQNAASGGTGLMGRDEKKALKQAEEAERAFRASKGYEPDTFWYRLKKKFLKK